MLSINTAEILLAYAEISVGFAGFASIVVVLKRRAAGNWEPLDAFRFGAMLRASLLTAFFTLLPLPLLQFGVAESRVWQFTSLLIAVYMIWSAIYTVRTRNIFKRGVWVSLLVYLTAIGFSQIIYVFGWISSGSTEFVLLGLVACLILAGWHFYRLVLVTPDAAVTG
ncbi:MAG: hypothetical protein MJA83_09455 [Gammaproteobacteria bacterium]|nr:hypothetical protein [Gammaproteobacteria bacterium]